MVFQSYALYPYMSVAENIELPLVMRRLSRAQRLPLIGRLVPGCAGRREAIGREVAAVAQSLGIDHLMARRPGQLSGGQRQRVALARAMVRHPQVFLMDEPLSNLDAKLRVQARGEIAELHRRLGTTFVYVTHDQAEAMTMSDRVAVMIGGRLLQVAAPQDIYDQPATLEVAQFVGTPEINVIDATVRPDGIVSVLGRPWPLCATGKAGEGLRLALRPEALAVSARDGHWLAGALTGTIRHLELLGSETLVHVGVNGLDRPLVARLDPSASKGLGLGDALPLSVRATRVLAFDREGQRVGLRVVPAVPRFAELVRA